MSKHFSLRCLTSLQGGWTPLHKSALDGRYQVADVLIRGNAQLNLPQKVHSYNVLFRTVPMANGMFVIFVCVCGGGGGAGNVTFERVYAIPKRQGGCKV